MFQIKLDTEDLGAGLESHGARHIENDLYILSKVGS